LFDNCAYSPKIISGIDTWSRRIKGITIKEQVNLFSWRKDKYDNIHCSVKDDP
jgi:hypothetical protein